MREPSQRVTFRDDALEMGLRAELLCHVPPELTARLLALVPHEEVLFRATPRQRRATLWLMALLSLTSVAVAWPLYSLALDVSGLDTWLPLLLSEIERARSWAFTAWPTLQQWALIFDMLRDLLQGVLAALLLWLGVEYLRKPRLHSTVMR